MNRNELMEALARWNVWGRGLISTGMPRDEKVRSAKWLDRPQALAIVGMRRCGKSTLMRQLAEKLIEGGTADEEILIVNFEEPVFYESAVDHRLLDYILNVYLQELQPRGIPHLFLDEIHNVEGWERWARVRLDTNEIRLTISGSSSSILEPEVSAVLTGRCVVRTLWPLSFREYLRIRGVEVPERSVRTAGSLLQEESVRYLRYGGMPEVALSGDVEVKETLLKQYFRDIIYRDVVRRHDVRNVRALESLAHNLLVNTGNLTTYNRLKNKLGLAMDQVRSYFSYLEDCYLIISMPRFSWKASNLYRAPRKVYATDTGLRNAVSFRFSGDLGRLAETAVAVQLARDADARLFYHAGRNECDFIVWKGQRAVSAVQVCWDEDSSIPEREFKGLLEAMREQGLEEGYLITCRDEGTVELPEGVIHKIPLWLWLTG